MPNTLETHLYFLIQLTSLNIVLYGNLSLNSFLMALLMNKFMTTIVNPTYV